MPERWWGATPEAVKHLRKAASCQLAAMGMLTAEQPGHASECVPGFCPMPVHRACLEIMGTSDVLH